MTATEKCQTIIEERRMKQSEEDRKTEFMQNRFAQLRHRIDAGFLSEQRAVAQIEAEWEIHTRNEADRRERYAKWNREK